jgi:alpha-L-arabinofuranosidase
VNSNASNSPIDETLASFDPATLLFQKGVTMLHTLRFTKSVLLASTLLLLPLAAATRSDDGVTTIRLTDEVLVHDTMRWGINLGGDAYYSGGALVKKRARANFEGTMYRTCHFGPGSDVEGVSTWFRPREPWREVIIGGQFTILSGPSKWTQGTVRDIGSRQYRHQGQMKSFDHFLLDRPLTVSEENPRIGIMIQRDRTHDGQLRSLDGYWCSKQNEISIGDVAADSFGCAALKLVGAKEKAHYRFATHYQRYGQTNGIWRVRFKARAVGGRPKLAIRPDRNWGEPVVLQPGGAWEVYEEALNVDSVPEPTGAEDNPHLTFTFESTAGNLLIDDVEIWLEGDKNPTAFRDDVIATLKRYQPGVLRKLQMGGSTIENTIRPPLQSFAYASQPGSGTGPYESHITDPYGLHEMYELCEYIGCDPWYCLPGTITREEMRAFLEYIGAPADTGLGQLRAALGHPQPWTEVFERIHVEFGNEAWNNAGSYQCGGYNGPDYWNDLIATGKQSPHCTSGVVFHAAGQASYAGRNEGIMADCPIADRFSVAPYIIQKFSKDEVTRYYNTPDKLFRWAFAWPIRRSTSPDGAMYQNAELAKAVGMELSIYEVNHHITHGDGPLEARNELVTSIGGGLNVANNMLLMLKDHHLRTQCLFSLIQHGYNAHGIGEVRLWGTALCMREGHERYRPTFLACATANRVIGGDLVATRHEGANPTFSAEGVFSAQDAEMMKDIPTIWSYAFQDGNRRGLILINLDTARARRVSVAFDGRVADGQAQGWLLASEKISDSNEFEEPAPKVAVREATLDGFASGYTLPLNPHSLTALTWIVQ